MEVGGNREMAERTKGKKKRERVQWNMDSMLKVVRKSKLNGKKHWPLGGEG